MPNSRPGRSLTAGLSRWLPPLAWIGVIFGLSTDAFSADRTGAVLEPLLRWLLPAIRPAQIALAHALVRKGAHVAAYATLALLVRRAVGGGTRGGVRQTLATLAIVGGCALLDELHQSFTLHRTASLRDTGIDLVGGCLALAVTAAWGRRSRPEAGTARLPGARSKRRRGRRAA
ncbi:MAG: VanZ family protein [Deltaproteobacteria bacterium]|nr:VanZ family protein [Deltaproteobacteria bacterium]